MRALAAWLASLKAASWRTPESVKVIKRTEPSRRTFTTLAGFASRQARSAEGSSIGVAGSTGASSFGGWGVALAFDFRGGASPAHVGASTFIERASVRALYRQAAAVVGLLSASALVCLAAKAVSLSVLTTPPE